MRMAKISLATLIIFLALVLTVLSSQQINLTTADLGRHIKNGEMFFQNFSVPQGNIYSYTNPDHPFINHHWGSGVIFYLVHSLAGFNGLSVLFILLSLATFLIFFHIAVKYSDLVIAAIVSIFVIPVLGSRVEIRPEVFSYLFLGLFFWILWNYNNEKISRYWLLFLPVIIFIWVNLHIYFFLGIAMIGAFLVSDCVGYLIAKDKKIIQQSKWLLIVLILSGFASLINPAGIDGALYPLKIFNDYGYRLFENQSVWFIEKLMDYPPALYFEIVFGILSLSWIAVIYMAIKNRMKFSVVNFILALSFGAMGWLAIRNFTIFGYFALPITAINMKSLFGKKPNEFEGAEYFSTLFSVIIILVILIMININYWHSRSDIGLGVEPEVNGAVGFFKKENMKGPIFNNYDIGGYLIYHLYPKERVFVDNRPEAYPKSFFEETYVPMQEKDEIWQKELEKYKFNVIFFYRNDLTPWAQSFLIRRVSDPDWALVYANDYTIIFLRRNDQNKPLIQKYELLK